MSDVMKNVWSKVSTTRQWIQQHKRVLAGVAVGSIAIAGYWAYNRIAPVIDEVRNNIAMMRSLEHEMAKDEENAMQEKLKRGFEMNMDACRITSSTMAIAIRKKSGELFDVESIRRQLRKGNRDEKDYALLDSFKVTLLSRSIMSYYAVCLADALVKVQINIIGRYAYVSPSTLSAEIVASSNECEEANRMFLGLSQCITSDALNSIAVIVKQVVMDVTSSITMQTSLSIIEFHTILNTLRMRLDEELITRCMHYMLPMQHTLLSYDNNTLNYRFNEMLSETTSLLRSASFIRVLTASVDAVFATLAPIDTVFCTHNNNDDDGDDEDVGYRNVRFGKLLLKINNLYEKSMPQTPTATCVSAVLRILDEQAGLRDMCHVIYYPLQRSSMSPYATCNNNHDDDDDDDVKQHTHALSSC